MTVAENPGQRRSVLFALQAPPQIDNRVGSKGGDGGKVVFGGVVLVGRPVEQATFDAPAVPRRIITEVTEVLDAVQGNFPVIRR